MRDLSPKTFAILLALLLAVAFGHAQWVTWSQYASHRTFLADVGVFDALCAQPTMGIFPRSPIDWTVDANYFATHLQPVVFLIAPFYLIHNGTMTFLTFLNVCLVGAAWPLALFAWEKLQHRGLALAVAFAYLTNHFTASMHLANHPETIALASFFTLFLAVEKRWAAVAVAAFLVTASVKEDYALYLGAYGVALLWERDPWRRRAAFAIMGGAAAWWVFALVTMKWCGQDAMYAAGNKPIGRLASLGSTKTEIVLTAVTHPLMTAGRLLRPALFALFASTGFLALRDWRTAWLVLAGAGLFLLSDDPFLHTLQYYYSYAAVPFLFYATVRGAALLQQDFAKWPGRFTVGLAAALVLIGVISAPMRTRTDDLRREPFPVNNHHRLADEIARHELPADAKVAVQYDLFCKVPNRAVKLPMRLWALDHVDYVFGDNQGRAADLYGEEKRVEREALIARLGSGEWEPAFEGDGYFLLRRAKKADRKPVPAGT